MSKININFKKDLTSLGYRELNNTTWGKPFGYHLLIYDLVKNEWLNFFKEIDHESMVIWESKFFQAKKKSDNNQFINFLKDCEAYTNVQRHKSDIDFQFLTLQEKIQYDYLRKATS